MAIEEAKYEVVLKDGACELRDYAPHIVAEVAVEAGFEEAGNLAFRRLFRYISGNNRVQGKIAMTAPVGQEARGGKIAMTAPVGQQTNAAGWTVSFMMPTNFTMVTLPAPLDPGVKLREVPARRMAAVRYSGRWTAKGYDYHKAELEDWIRKKELVVDGDAVWARYDPPFMPSFFRRNEILFPVRPPAAK